MPSERGLSHCALLCPVRRNATGVDVARDQAVFRHVVMIARLNQTLLADDYRPASATSRLSESWTLRTSRREIGQGALGVLALVVIGSSPPVATARAVGALRSRRRGLSGARHDLYCARWQRNPYDNPGETARHIRVTVGLVLSSRSRPSSEGDSALGQPDRSVRSCRDASATRQ